MKYLLLMYANEFETPEDTSGMYQAWMDYMKEANAAGVHSVEQRRCAGKQRHHAARP